MPNNFLSKEHRLFKIAFFGLFLLSLYLLYSDFFLHSPHIPQWKVVGSVDERISTDVAPISDLAKPDERVEERGRAYALNSGTNEYERFILEDVYCSTDMANRIADVQEKTGVNNLFIERLYGTKSVSTKVFSDFIRENHMKCVVVNAYSYPENPGQKLEFLAPDKSLLNMSFQNDFVFYKKSNLHTTLYVLKWVLLDIAIFLGIAIIYNKSRRYGSRVSVEPKRRKLSQSRVLAAGGRRWGFLLRFSGFTSSIKSSPSLHSLSLSGLVRLGMLKSRVIWLPQGRS